MRKSRKKLKVPRLDENLRERVCLKKTRYATPELAAMAVEMYGGVRRFLSYRCPFCELYHNASKDIQ